jgi:2-amino-4-hydroxy-6-hydroxymethyldihydropteridine diphosphokinase
LDLCILDCEIVDQPTYKLPDPDLLTRAHLAIPMADLAPDLSHPQTGERLERIADRLRSSSELRLRPDVSERLRSLISR